MHFLSGLNPPVRHRDLRSANILLTKQNGVLTAKLIDFGLALWGNCQANSDFSYQYIRTTAPEILCAQGSVAFEEYSDMYAFGIVLWELLFCQNAIYRSPFDGHLLRDEELITFIMRGGRLPLPLICADSDQSLREFVELIYKCWHQDVHQRPTFEQVNDALTKICEFDFFPLSLAEESLYAGLEQFEPSYEQYEDSPKDVIVDVNDEQPAKKTKTAYRRKQDVI